MKKQKRIILSKETLWKLWVFIPLAFIASVCISIGVFAFIFEASAANTAKMTWVTFILFLMWRWSGRKK